MCDIFVFLLLSVKIYKTNKTTSKSSIRLFHSLNKMCQKEMNKHIEFNVLGRWNIFFEDNEPYCIRYERCLEMPIDSFDVIFVLNKIMCQN